MTAAHYDDNGASEQLPAPEPRWAEALQEDPVDREFRAKVWTALYFALAVFGGAVAAVVVGVWW